MALKDFCQETQSESNCPSTCMSEDRKHGWADPGSLPRIALPQPSEVRSNDKPVRSANGSFIKFRLAGKTIWDMDSQQLLLILGLISEGILCVRCFIYLFYFIHFLIFNDSYMRLIGVEIVIRVYSQTFLTDECVMKYLETNCSKPVTLNSGSTTVLFCNCLFFQTYMFCLIHNVS